MTNEEKHIRHQAFLEASDICKNWYKDYYLKKIKSKEEQKYGSKAEKEIISLADNSFKNGLELCAESLKNMFIGKAYEQFI